MLRQLLLRGLKKKFSPGCVSAEREVRQGHGTPSGPIQIDYSVNRVPGGPGCVASRS